MRSQKQKVVPMFHQYFKTAMDFYGVKCGELAREFGISISHLSRLRSGKCSTYIDEFWRLLDTMDALAPGSKQYFFNLLAGQSTLFDIPEIIATLDPEELAHYIPTEDLYLLHEALVERMRKMPSLHCGYIELAHERDLPLLSVSLIKRLRESGKLYRLVETFDDEELSQLMMLMTKKLAKRNQELQNSLAIVEID